MQTRCTNPKAINYADYGGRGITVCERWRSFENFYSDMGPRPSSDHSLERISNNEPYAPANCRWATTVEQSNNKRSNNMVEACGRKQTVVEWARESGIPAYAIYHRLYNGWDPERAVTEPIHTNQRRYRHP
jgi:hypothetical protein